MKSIFCCMLLLGCTLFSACGEDRSISETGGADEPTQIVVDDQKTNLYEQISADEAKAIMDSGQDYVLLDVRTQEEFDAEHIPGAVLIPHEEITAQASGLLPDKDALILVYCRSGRRSKIAAQALADLGYTNVKEFGGIINWPYETE